MAESSYRLNRYKSNDLYLFKLIKARERTYQGRVKQGGRYEKEKERILALPHIGSATHETRYTMAACAVDNLITALTGEVKENFVNPQLL